MARKEKKYHFIYKTTNLLSGRYYIGMHSTDNMEDGYLGSGNRIRLAIRKHGKENFKREILEFVDTRQLLGEREREIVNLDEIAKEECMNLVVGGEAGGFKDEEHMMKCVKAGTKARLEKMNTDSEFKEDFNRKKEIGLKKARDEGRMPTWKDNYSWEGKTHSEETKNKLSKVMKGKGTGTNNSQYGKCWITNEIESKKINKCDTIPEGWRLGRNIKK